MFQIHKEEIEINGKKITLETGKIARQADGAIIATCGETVVIATVVGAKKLDMKFLPRLAFVEDNSFEYAEKIERLININKKNDAEKKRND